jgi:hypothetical protein
MGAQENQVALEAAARRPVPAGFRRLEVGERIGLGDMVWPHGVTDRGMTESMCVGGEVEGEDAGFYYRPLSLDAPGVPEPQAKGSPSPEPPQAGEREELIRELVGALERIESLVVLIKADPAMPRGAFVDANSIHNVCAAALAKAKEKA